MKEPDNKLSSGETARGIYQEGWASIGGDYGPYNRFGDVDRKAKFYGSKPKPTTTKNDEKDDTYKGSKQGGKVKFAKSIKEMDTSGMRQSTNIDDRRGLVGSIKGAYKVFSDKAHRQGMTGTQAQGAAAIDTAKSVASTAAERLANNLNDRFAPKFPQSWSGSKPSSGLSPAEKEPISSPTGATPPSIERGTKSPQGTFANQMDSMDTQTPRSDELSGRTFTVDKQNKVQLLAEVLSETNYFPEEGTLFTSNEYFNLNEDTNRNYLYFNPAIVDFYFSNKDFLNFSYYNSIFVYYIFLQIHHMLSDLLQMYEQSKFRLYCKDYRNFLNLHHNVYLNLKIHSQITYRL